MANIEERDGAVVHLNEADADKQQTVLRNVGNLLDEMGPDLHVELVAHGPGITVCLIDSPHAPTVDALIGRAVTFAACENTMRMKHIEAGQLIDGVITVASGLAELVRKQQAGWSYVHP